jgi:peptidoglycan hydrolase-like amidase
MIQTLATLHISVLSLFHPTELTVRPAQASAIVLETASGKQVLEARQTQSIKGPAKVVGRDGGPASFILSVPNRIAREYFGKLEVRREGDHLLALVEMDRETAVASIVDAESPGSSREARNAQAVVARSYLVGTHGRHTGYDFCDTTHCQYLRGVSHKGAQGETAAINTGGLAISYQGHVVPALYSADCGGHTRSLEEAGWGAAEYPFFGVACPVKGAMRGHGIGLCQRGAMELAREGKSFREIVGYFFPATVLVSLDAL